MQRSSVLTIITCLIVFLLCSCVTGTDINGKNKDGSPIWTTEVPKSNRYLYGVGRAKLLMDSNSEQAADATARADLAKKINVNVKDALAMYSNEAPSVVVSAYETVIVESVNLTMKRVVVEQRWTAEDGTVWSLVSFRIKDLPDLYADSANNYMNQLEEKRIATQNKLIELLSELGDSQEPDVLELKKMAQEKADAIISETEEIISNIDVQAQRNDLADYLAELGFELSD